ncbi:RNA-binding protein [candidate division WWE3 bacterium RIFCSPHIGHO2_01_FULL_48_15]|uniref:RNA-binding protein n=1 Tax=candidate division WWE3 bacterium RIFCSPHIGHO2_01_FULL_48_15 TaxID=1802619 RepID=A0A1F4VFB7_UNCKA|nr:MAG: RNA-binding protein [candidate division WWE3 bacterium RIFCSPHIGHO2_01_FULL_48_15]
MSKRLFVGGLPRSFSNSQLEEMFAPIGNVASATVITDRDTGQGKGFGFVEMEKDNEADDAIAKLNETELEGRKITVNVARPREERPRFDSRGGGGRGGRW